jgi:hypothetical protein
MEFLRKYQGTGLAVAFFIGTAPAKLVNSTVTDIIMPIVAVVTPFRQLADLSAQDRVPEIPDRGLRERDHRFRDYRSRDLPCRQIRDTEGCEEEDLIFHERTSKTDRHIDGTDTIPMRVVPHFFTIMQVFFGHWQFPTGAAKIPDLAQVSTLM